MGTYSGYAEHFDGWAFSVEINVGAYSDPSHEVEELRERQQAVAQVIAPFREPLQQAVEHFRSGSHGYRRCLSLLDPAARDYEGPEPEPLWSSEARTRGARFPAALLGLPEPLPDDDGGLSIVTRPQRPDRVDLYLYLRGTEVPYRLREVIDGHLIAAQFAAGGLFAGAAVAAEAALEQVLQDAWDGVNRHSVCRLLHHVTAQAPDVTALADTGDPAQPATQVAQVCAAFLQPERVTPALITDAARHRATFTLLASVATDQAWERCRAEFEAVDAELALAPPE
ncbi:MAG: hypothetical protein ACYTGX_01995 [Planctomycetota bacterium]